MQRFMKKVRHATGQDTLAKDERGLSTVEYVIILVLVAAAAVTLWVKFGDMMQKKLGAAHDEIDGKVNVEASEGSSDQQ